MLGTGAQRGTSGAFGAGEIALGPEHQAKGGERIGLVGHECQRAAQHGSGLAHTALHEKHRAQACVQHRIARAHADRRAQLPQAALEFVEVAKHKSAQAARLGMLRIDGNDLLEPGERLDQAPLTV